jgi:hypothetical protein
MDKAAQIYATPEAAAHVKAQAAWTVAQGHLENGNLDEARRWGRIAAQMNDLDVPGIRRTERETRIRNWLLRLPQTPDTTGS